MGTCKSKHEWHPPDIDMSLLAGTSVAYHKVSARVDLDSHVECCVPGMSVTVDCDTLYAMLGEQYAKGYRMIHLTRSPGKMSGVVFSMTVRIILQAFFRKNTEAGIRGRYRDCTSWRLHVVKGWLQAYVHNFRRYTRQARVVHTTNLVECVARNTRNGERLVSTLVTGQAEPQSVREKTCGMSSYIGVDLFFEIPTSSLAQLYKYKMVLVAAVVVFRHQRFPDIECDWTHHLNQPLSQGWRLIDICIDVSTTLTHPHREPTQGRPIETDVVWIFEKPASRMHDHTPLYEGAIVEHPVKVQAASSGLSYQSKPDWDQVIFDMGSLGWELACTLESVSCVSLNWRTVQLKSLFFFQRPLL